MENIEIGLVKHHIDRIQKELKKVIIEQDELLEYSLIALIAGGHVLLEGVPGLAKTLMIRSLAKTLSVDFKRIQFTPDMMPADITGTTVFNMQTREFELKKVQYLQTFY